MPRNCGTWRWDEGGAWDVWKIKDIFWQRAPNLGAKTEETDAFKNYIKLYGFKSWESDSWQTHISHQAMSKPCQARGTCARSLWTLGRWGRHPWRTPSRPEPIHGHTDLGRWLFEILGLNHWFQLCRPGSAYLHQAFHEQPINIEKHQQAELMSHIVLRKSLSLCWIIFTNLNRCSPQKWPTKPGLGQHWAEKLLRLFFPWQRSMKKDLNGFLPQQLRRQPSVHQQGPAVLTILKQTLGIVVDPFLSMWASPKDQWIRLPAKDLLRTWPRCSDTLQNLWNDVSWAKPHKLEKTSKTKLINFVKQTHYLSFSEPFTWREMFCSCVTGSGTSEVREAEALPLLRLKYLLESEPKMANAPRSKAANWLALALPIRPIHWTFKEKVCIGRQRHQTKECTLYMNPSIHNVSSCIIMYLHSPSFLVIATSPRGTLPEAAAMLQLLPAIEAPGTEICWISCLEDTESGPTSTIDTLSMRASSFNALWLL